MNKLWKIAVGVLLVVTAFSVYNWLNIAVSLDHARQQQETDWQRNKLLSEFISVSNAGAKRADILRLARLLGNNHVVKEEDNRIEIDGVAFRFDGEQKLTKVDPTIYVY